MRSVYAAANTIDAQRVVDLLASVDVAAHVQGQFLSGGIGELPAGDLVRVWVTDEDVLRARAAIDADEGAPRLQDDAMDARLSRSWTRAWAALGAAGGGVVLRDRLVAAWSEPQRRYHTLRHLIDCLDLLEPLLDAATHPGEVEIALWFHDAVYALKARDNEARSADWARRELVAAGVPAATADRVHALVMATRHDAPATDADARLLVDVDLGILGAEPGRFDEYDVEVREEYAWVPGPLYRSTRRRVLQGFLDRDVIYATPAIHAARETRARDNLRRAIARLRPWWRVFS